MKTLLLTLILALHLLIATTLVYALDWPWPVKGLVGVLVGYLVWMHTLRCRQ